MQKYYNTKIYDTALTVDDLTSEAIIISFDESGYTVKGNDNIDGKNAILDISSSYSNTENPNWEKITLFQETGWYYFENDISKKGWNQVTYKPNNEACYYFYPVSGVMLTGWQVINKRLYYLGPQSGLISGIKQKGNITIDSTTYVLDNVDSCNDNHGYLTGYLNNGTITKGWINIDDKTYYLDDENKIAVSEWKKINDNWYHFDSQGQILTGWQKFNEKWYYLGDDGIMINDKCMTINNKDFCFDTNGVCYSGNGC